MTDLELAAKLRECDDLRELNNDLIRSHEWTTKLLDGVALALKGAAPPNGMHSWADLPELAQSLVDKLIEAKAR
jgi:hypothetical protein